MNKSITLDDVLEQALYNARDKFRRLAFDERDSYPSYQEELEKILGRKLITSELKNREFKKTSRLIGKAADAAGNLAYQNRIGNGITKARANLVYEKALANVYFRGIVDLPADRLRRLGYAQ